MFFFSWDSWYNHANTCTYYFLNKKDQTNSNISPPLTTAIEIPIVLDPIATNHSCYKLTAVLTQSKIPAVQNKIISVYWQEHQTDKSFLFEHFMNIYVAHDCKASSHLWLCISDPETVRYITYCMTILNNLKPCTTV